MTAESSRNEAAQAMPQIRGYKLLRVVGHGGMSTVYLAEQESLGRKVAVKVMLPEALADEVSRRRFENEARTIARLDHPNIVSIFEVGRTTGGLPFYAMPHLGRGHLGARIARSEHGLDEARTIAILRALLAALDYAHVHGVVHRDVKAENVLFDEAERPLLADFGIALRKGANPRLTMTGLAVGSTAYMPPEQARGEDVDTRADLYSIGVLAWEMLTGNLPFMAGDALSMAVMHAQDPIPRLPLRLRHWQGFIDRAMAKSPEQRFRSARLMLEALDGIERGEMSGGALLARAAGAARALTRRPALLVAGVAAVLAAGWWLADEGGPREFFRIARAPVPTEAPAAVADDPVESMLRPPPESPAQRWIVAAQAQVARRNLTSPQGDNAYESVLAAFEADRGHAGLGEAVALVVDALGAQLSQRLAAGDDKAARTYLARAQTLATRTAPLGDAALARVRADAGKALQARVAAAERRASRRDAGAAAALALEFTGDKRLAADLQARAGRIAQAGQRVAGDPTGAVVVGDGGFAGMRRAVTRAEYARFTAATGRAASLCRERLSLLRIVKPRTWREPGFNQGESDPVVCVSHADAAAYAEWISRTTGQRYRLPSGPEWREIGAGERIANRPLAEWVGERGLVNSGGNRRPDAARGYADVGFRLVRDL